MEHPAVVRAKEIVATSEWSGDLRANMTKVIGAGRVLAKRLAELDLLIVELAELLTDARDCMCVIDTEYTGQLIDKIDDKLKTVSP